MKATLFFAALSGLVASQALHGQLILTEIQSDQQLSGAGDYWELTNVGAATVPIGGYKYTDSARTAASAVTIPAGTTIAAGESIVFTGVAPAAFRSFWANMPAGVQVINPAPNPPGLGMNDGITLYDASNNEVFFFSYAANGFTRSSGSASAGGHAGSSAGGTATQAMVWDPSYGITNRRYTSGAASSALGTFNASGANTGDVGSPGFSGFGVSAPTIALTVTIAPGTFSESAANPAANGTVSRSGPTTTDLTVNLASSDTTEASVPATVTILAGNALATFPVTAVDDGFPDGAKPVTVTASATNATAGTTQITVQDDGDVITAQLLLTEINSNQSATAPGGAEDFWELTNFGPTGVSLAGYGWHDSGRSAATAASYALPAGSTIDAGESVIFTVASPASFRAQWGIPSSVKVFQTIGAPGLGKADGISLFESGGNELFFFSYAAGGFTKSDGNPSTGDHAGISAGGTIESQSLIWDPTSGIAAPRYTFADGTNFSTFKAAIGTDLGSPGSKGTLIPTVSIDSASLVEGDAGTSTIVLNVTRNDVTTAFAVDYAVTGGTAAAGTDYVPLASGKLTFTAGGVANQTIDLTINGDIDPEPNETVFVTLSNVVNATGSTIIGTAQGTATIVNDDPIAPVIGTAPASVSVVSGASATLTIAVSGTPTPTIQWYRGNSGDTTNPVGTNSASFITPALTGATHYWVRVTNSAGSVDSATITVSIGATPSTIDLSTYVRVGRYDLPEPTRTVAPPGNLLAQEASGVAFNWDTNTLFIACDGGKSITQVSKTGQLIDTMTLAAGSSPQGTAFYDPEGITYIGNGQFVMTEERDRQLVLFTYAAGTTLTRANTKTVKLGTFVDNTGTEGLSYDPQTGGFICLKEISPMGIFLTEVDFNAGTATNGSPTTENSVNLFDPALTGFADLADVFALSNLPFLNGQPQSGNLLLLSQESARIINVDRLGNISSTLQIVADPGSPLTAPNQQHEGLTMDRDGILYVVNENGGGDIDHPQLWVYAPSALPNQAPTAVSLNNAVTSIAETVSTTNPIKVADIVVADDGLGTNALSVSGADAASFEITGTSLFVKAGTALDFETKTSFSINVQVDDTTVGNTPDATVAFTLTIIDVVNETPVPTLIISEVAPWSSGSVVGADWFEVTNTGTAEVNLGGWKVDDNSNSFASAVALNGVTSIAPGESVIFLETGATNQAAVVALFKSTWFGANPPANLKVGSYNGSGIGLSGSGDALNLYNASGVLQANVTFGVAPSATPFATFNNGVGLNNAAISTLSKVNVHGAFAAVNDATEVGSPGTTGKLFISEVAPWGSGSSPYESDWFEVTNAGARAVNLTGWKMDDNSNAFASGLPLNGVTSIAPGESVIFMETATAAELPAKAALFLGTWFGGSQPIGLQIGSYSGGGAGLSTGGDAVNLFNASGARVTGVAFGAAPTGPFASFDNKAALGSEVLPLPMIPTLSATGVNGASVAINDAAEIGSPGTTGKVLVTEVAPWSSGDSPIAADWFEITNTGATAVDLTGWKVDDNSESPIAAVALNGVSTIAPGESVIFIETAAPSTVVPVFLTTWFGANVPAGLQVGSYTGSGIGLGTSGDAVNLYDANGIRRANLSFATSPSTAPFATFDNAAGVNVGAVTLLSKPGINGAFVAKGDSKEIGSPGAIANRGPLDLALWLDANGVSSGNADADSDGLSNLLEFAFGLNPQGVDNAGNNTNVAGGLLVSRGTPVIYSQPTANGQDFRVVFNRRKDAAAAGLSYTPQFSPDLIVWENSNATPTVIASDSEMEAVSIRYPFFVNGKKAQFFRVIVSTAP